MKKKKKRKELKHVHGELLSIFPSIILCHTIFEKGKKMDGRLFLILDYFYFCFSFISFSLEQLMQSSPMVINLLIPECPHIKLYSSLLCSLCFITPFIFPLKNISSQTAFEFFKKPLDHQKYVSILSTSAQA